MDTGDDEGEGGEDIAKVKDNEIERPDDAENEEPGGSSGNFRVKKSRGKEEEVDHCGR